MMTTLFSLAGIAMLGWALMVFAPAWRVTRRVAESALFPVYLCLLYAVGIVAVMGGHGLGIMGEFGEAAGVVRLLAVPDIALVAWIHILAFDHLVGLHIYRDNMRRRRLSLPLQSAVLVLTLMLGPLGFLSYLALGRAGRLAARVRAGLAASAVAARARAALSWLAAERAVAGLGVLGLLLGALCGGLILLRGPTVGVEGDLFRPMTFNVAAGIYLLTLAALLPLADFSPRGRWRWRWSMVVLALYSYGIETIQSMRGLNPRFTRVGAVPDQIAGAVFGLVSLGLIAAFLVLSRRLLAGHLREWRPLLERGIRFGAGATILAFGAGTAMSFLNGRHVGESGNLLWLHAIGFHGLQAVPLAALLLERSRLVAREAQRWLEAAGWSWIAACLLVGGWSLAGNAVLAPSAPMLLAGALLLVAPAAALRAVLTWRSWRPLPLRLLPEG